jgi:hypothetical protein
MVPMPTTPRAHAASSGPTTGVSLALVARRRARRSGGDGLEAAAVL